MHVVQMAVGTLFVAALLYAHVADDSEFRKARSWTVATYAKIHRRFRRATEPAWVTELRDFVEDAS